jgi:hypothetical protein
MKIAYKYLALENKFICTGCEEKRTLVRPRCKWKENIKVDLQEVGWVMECIDLAQIRNM